MGKNTNNNAPSESAQGTSTLEDLMKLSQEELAQKVIGLEKSLDDAAKEFVAVVEDLKAENEALRNDVSASKDVVISFKKKSYKVLNPKVRVGKSIINASELEEYPDAIASILEIEGQNILQEVK